MEKRTILTIFLLGVISMVFCDKLHVKAETITRETIDEVDMRLKLLNKRAVKSIKSRDGDIIDCVDIYKQPVFNHPALRNHKIQMKPSFHVASSETPTSKNDTSHQVVSQTWQRSGGFCPNATIPIRRIRRKDLLAANSLNRFGKKNPQPHLYAATNTTENHRPAVVYVNDTKAGLGQVNRSAAVLLTVGYNFIGAQGDINLWNPRVSSPEDYSAAQIWLKNGPAESFESVEAGWMVNPKLYGDTLSRLFIYWTTDAYKSTGCFDLTCSGFVQTNPKVVLGAALEPCSSEMGPQYQMTVSINMDPSTSNWWLRLGQGNPVGYWPGTLFNYLQHSAILVEWGGEVYSPNVKKSPHTTTAMGSGDYASTLEGSACYVKQVRIVDYSLALKYPEWVGTWADEDYCYSAYNYIQRYGVEPVLYFGGPGRNTLCP
ncbi:hypothetical protein PanWU01x14_033490 [Parasponia andersonii]|uniref:Neprosin PEP catalytic domain-containing protein n=1 Tax=Parasponia andersonii TaxID=3476 RepID=A0A2P5DTN8_PARAD|nr:hypothetical protein PanWU01x14_033490 [Parasponia andersonii]